MPTTADPATAQRDTKLRPASHLLCAYSPRWLSGPIPGYEGLCASYTTADDGPVWTPGTS